MRVKILKISRPPMHKQFSGQNRPDFPKSQEDNYEGEETRKASRSRRLDNTYVVLQKILYADTCMLSL